VEKKNKIEIEWSYDIVAWHEARQYENIKIKNG